MTDRPPARTTTTVTLHGQCHLYPYGTTYGGGATSHRDPDAAPVAATPPLSRDAALAELGNVGEALRWALDRALVQAADPARALTGGDDPEPVDVLTWQGTMTLPDWLTFAHTYLLDVDRFDGHPTRAALVGARAWVDHADGMLFNEGGVTRVHHVRLEITVHEPSKGPAVPLPDRDTLLRRLPADDTIPGQQIDTVFQDLAAHLAGTSPDPATLAAWIDTALDTYVERVRPTVAVLTTTRLMAQRTWVDGLVDDPAFADLVRAVWAATDGDDVATAPKR